MRALIIIAAASIALTACGKHDQGNTAQNSASDLTADKIVANDVTAIDAVTADSANMAADMNYDALDSIDLNGSADNGSGPAKRSAKPAARKSEKPATSASTNTAGAAPTTNAQ